MILGYRIPGIAATTITNAIDQDDGVVIYHGFGENDNHFRILTTLELYVDLGTRFTGFE